MRKLSRNLVPLAAMFFCSAPAQAYDLGMFEIHGFGSVGYIHSSDNNVIEESTDGSFHFNDFGLNVGATFWDDVYVGFQVMSRDYGAVANNDIIVNWALINYQFKDQLGFKVGKIKRPVGLYGDLRDYDFLRTPILLPQSIYSETAREYYESYTGGAVYGAFDLGGGGRLGYDIYYGTEYTIEDDGGLARGMNSDESRFVDGTIDYAFGGRLKWHTPLSGLLFAMSYSQLEANINTESWLMPVSMDFTLPVSHSVIFSTEYSHAGFTAAAEYEMSRGDYTYTIDMSRMGQPSTIYEGEMKGENYYIMCSYQFIDWFTLGAYYSVHTPNSDDRDGDELVAQGLDDYGAWQKDLALTTRFDITDFWLIKLEYHYVDGTASLQDVDNPDGYEKSWDYWSLKTTLNF